MSNAEKLLYRLDVLLNAKVDLTLYGRAALLLGYPEPKREYALSLDVDAVLWIGQAEELVESSNFWDALDQVNREFEDDGLYMTHLFDEDQVVLRPNWREQRVAVHGAFHTLALHRLGDADLLLSKMMRYDASDLDDLVFIIEHSDFTPADVGNIVKQARLTNSPEILVEFDQCRSWLIRQGLCVCG